ncbi:amino acid ABC transporter permease [Mesorhizobium silamurunense]|uniref:amino acid ABC transporter permease n=1 Tax=Mesorhizobium silamurunense TaxID=499528 RepID=UPI00177DEF52|nr:amino acid ABC transporter permease [Mesorhizobium silamurunense]
MDAFWDWFRWLDEAYGIKLTIFYDEWDRGRFLKGLVTTIQLSFVCIVLSVIIGMIGAWFQMSSYASARRLVHAYIQFFRNTPPLVQLYFFYFAIDSAIAHLFDLHTGILSSFGWAVISLSFFAGAFNTEIFRAGLEAVPESTVEAAESLGYTKWQVYRYVTLPLAYRVCLPALNSNLVNLVKTTTVAYAIAVPETLYVSNQIWSDEFNVPEMMNVVWVVYLVLVGILVWLMHRWERAIRIPGFGRSSHE